MTKDEKKEYDEINNYVETSQPDIVAEYIRKLLKENERIAELEKEVAEKDKEIDILTVGLQIANQYSEEIYNKYVKDNKKQLRHEICEKIRNRLDFDINYTFDMNILKDILDEIEQAKESMK